MPCCAMPVPPTTRFACSHGLALALREIGRIERNLYALDWQEQPALRRQATAELNKGESHNALSGAVRFHRLGRLHDRTAQNQQHRASGLALVTAAIVLWNTIYLGRALETARHRGDVILDALLAHLARWDGSTSTSPGIISGTPPAILDQTGSGHCAGWKSNGSQPWQPDHVHGPCH